MSAYFEKVQVGKVTVTYEIIQALREKIATGEWPNGHRIPNERDLAQTYGVSQPTMREVIRSLETLGLVHVQHGRGTYIRSQGDYALALALQTLLQLESVGILEVLDVRQILGRSSVELAARNATEADIAAINEAVRNLDNLDDVESVEEILERIASFQRSVSFAAHNPLLHALEIFLLTLLLEVQVKSLKQRGLRFWRQRALEFKEDRKLILEGVTDHSPAAAGAAMQRYFDHQRQRFETDEALRELKLSDPHLVTAVAQMVRKFKSF